ncbi:WAP four-disulfide core domain protein 8-like isoform X1 [Pleurodeles waltl]|uniref:WAP four-disulfide core domain protein 8-like isoform X1 n=1 Tax=Pleurodeles waltl TaxID=8319 RepID=UPI0037099028
MKTSRGLLLPLVPLFFCRVQAEFFADLEEFTEKPGICPDLLFDCPRFEANECEQDGDCQGNSKCCLFRCRFMCAEPILDGEMELLVEEVKMKEAHLLGHLVPKTSKSTKDKLLKQITWTQSTPSAALRSTDDPKKRKEKVRPITGMSGTDGLQAVGLGTEQAEAEKIGSCPPDTSVCTTKEPNECEMDSDCLTNKRCCFSKCGLKCTSPLPGKIGHCPTQTTLCKIDQKIPPDQCTNDKQCPGQQKCCSPRCGIECTDPAINEKDGYCPYEENQCLKPQGGDLCKTDDDCPELQKCCGSCKKMCTRSVQATDAGPETAVIM